MTILDFNPDQQFIIVLRQGNTSYSSPEDTEVIREMMRMWQQHAGYLSTREQMSNHLSHLVSCFYRSQVNLIQYGHDNVIETLGPVRMYNQRLKNWGIGKHRMASKE